MKLTLRSYLSRWPKQKLCVAQAGSLCYDGPGAASASDLFLRRSELCQHAEILQCGGVSRYFCAGSDFFKQPPHDFATSGLWKRLGEAHFVGPCDCADVTGDVFPQFIL